MHIITPKYKVKTAILIVGIIFGMSLLCYLYFQFHAYLSYVNRTVNTDSVGIVDVLGKENSACINILVCDLRPGDILLRRFVTTKTYLFDRLVDPHFTHAALYIGDGKIVEASGTEKSIEDEVRIIDLQYSDWTDSDIESLVILRPKSYTKALRDNLVLRFLGLANNQNLGFGFNNSQTSCAEIIYRNIPEIFGESVSKDQIVTPDYLFEFLNTEGAIIANVK